MSQVNSQNGTGGNGAIAAKPLFGNFKIAQRVSAIVILGVMAMAVFGGIQVYGQSMAAKAVKSNTDYNTLAQKSSSLQQIVQTFLHDVRAA
tara:strand:- start:478 stop:750 length:273 start_codon:yes stop_codon:yes gene_type:complete